MANNRTKPAPNIPPCCRYSLRNMKRISPKQTGRVTYRCTKCGREETLNIIGI